MERRPPAGVAPTPSGATPKPNLGDTFFTVKMLAHELGVKPETVHEWIRRGELQAIRIGKEFRIAQTAIDAYMQEKQAAAELEQLQKQDAGVHWERTRCLRCGLVTVLSTRHQRLDGMVYCDPCRRKNEDGPITKDDWERSTVLRARELNNTAELELRLSNIPPHVIYRCGVCHRPQVIKRSDIDNPFFYPQCSHSYPFIGESMDENDGGCDGRVVDALADLELGLRLEEEQATTCEPAGWQISGCYFCGTGHTFFVGSATVTSRAQRLTGAFCCRACIRSRTKPERHAGSTDLAEILVCEANVQESVEAVEHPSGPEEFAWFNSASCSCGCSTEVVEHGANGDVVVLSWCQRRPEDERDRLATEWIARWRLSRNRFAARRLARLFDEVSSGVNNSAT